MPAESGTIQSLQKQLTEREKKIDELRELESKVSGLRVVFTMDEDPGWEGESRRIEPDMLGDVLGGDLKSFHFMIAGPPGMAKAVEASLLEAGMPEDQVHSDSFSGY